MVAAQIIAARRHAGNWIPPTADQDNQTIAYHVRKAQLFFKKQRKKGYKDMSESEQVAFIKAVVFTQKMYRHFRDEKVTHSYEFTADVISEIKDRLVQHLHLLNEYPQ
jgi:hypothetical protein